MPRPARSTPSPDLAVDLSQLDPPSAGFPGCGRCPYRLTGSPALCFSCADRGVRSPAGPTCRLCNQELGNQELGDQELGGGTCPNTVCTLADPEFSRIYIVSGRSEDMWDAICRYKYDEDRSWALVLGRVLVGFLEDHRAELESYDAITTGALYVGPEAIRLWDHLRLVLDAAQEVGPSWPFVPDLIHKAVPTGRFLGIGVEERRQIAEGELRAALAVPEPERVAGKRILVLDDVYSEGFSLREMARVLLRAGAVGVAGLVFARRKGG